jgi:hypothetical protein
MPRLPENETVSRHLDELSRSNIEYFTAKQIRETEEGSGPDMDIFKSILPSLKLSFLPEKEFQKLKC